MTNAIETLRGLLAALPRCEECDDPAVLGVFTTEHCSARLCGDCAAAADVEWSDEEAAFSEALEGARALLAAEDAPPPAKKGRRAPG